MSPLLLVAKLVEQEKSLTSTLVPEAVCLSTIGLDGFPNARFVAVKDISEDAVIITGPVFSRKGKEIESDSRVALTLWLTNVAVQVRVQGNATLLSQSDSERFFSQRNRDSQIVSTVSRQGQPLDNLALLESDFGRVKQELENNIVSCPKDWGGFSIKPIRIEILEFSATRFHKRTLWTRENGSWMSQLLQP